MKRMLAVALLASFAPVPGQSSRSKALAATGQSQRQRSRDEGSKVFLGVALDANADNTDLDGIRVRSVAPNSPAAKAGIAGTSSKKSAIATPRTSIRSWPTSRNIGPAIKSPFTSCATANKKPFPSRSENGPPPLRMKETAGAGRASGYLGVLSMPLNSQLKEKLGVTADKGALVTEVMPNTPAAKAGLKVDDLIISFAGRTISSPQELRVAVHGAQVGKDVPITVLCAGRKKSCTFGSKNRPSAGLISYRCHSWATRQPPNATIALSAACKSWKTVCVIWRKTATRRRDEVNSPEGLKYN